jgi:hypothetical protein
VLNDGDCLIPLTIDLVILFVFHTEIECASESLMNAIDKKESRSNSLENK